jgi:hypothetical protein
MPEWGRGAKRGEVQRAADPTYLGQEGRDKDEEDVIDEEHQQQQCAGLQSNSTGP